MRYFKLHTSFLLTMTSANWVYGFKHGNNKLNDFYD